MIYHKILDNDRRASCDQMVLSDFRADTARRLKSIHTHGETDTPLTFRYLHTSYVRSVRVIMLFSVSRSPATEGFAVACYTRDWPRRQCRHYDARRNRKFRACVTRRVAER